MAEPGSDDLWPTLPTGPGPRRAGGLFRAGAARMRLAGGLWLALATPLAASDIAEMPAEEPPLTLVLHSDRNACRLIALSDTGDHVVRLAMGGLCRFHRDPQGALRVMDTPEGKVVLVETSLQLPDDSGDCRTEVQAVRLTSTGPVPAPEAALVASCLPFQWDDAMFLDPF